MDRLEAMGILVAAVESGSLSAASRKLGTPLPTVSRKIAELEAHLKTRLLIRSTRRLALTDAGAAYVAASKRILEQMNDAERAASGEYSAPKGDLIITAAIVFGRLHVLPVVTDFLAAFPDINVRLALSDRNVHLVDDHIDMAVRIGALPDSSMVATRVGFVRRVVCGSPGYFAAHGTPTLPADLSDLACVSSTSSMPRRLGSSRRRTPKRAEGADSLAAGGEHGEGGDRRRHRGRGCDTAPVLSSRTCHRRGQAADCSDGLRVFADTSQSRPRAGAAPAQDAGVS